MRYRESLTYGSETIIISESEGLISAVDGFTRHPEGRSLFREFKAPLRFYGATRDWVKNIETTHGPDAIIGYLLERSIDNFVYENDFVGEVGVQTFIEGLEFSHYLEFNPVQLGMVRKFVNRFETKVDIQSATNLDGDSVTVYTPEVLNLPSQIIRYNGSYERVYNSPVASYSAGVEGMRLDWDTDLIDEFNKFSLTEGGAFVLGTNDINAVGVIEAPYDGNYVISAKVVTGVFVPGFPSHWQADSADFLIRMRKLGSTYYEDGTNTVETVASDSYLTSTLNTSIQLLKGEQLAIYGVFSAFASNRVSFGTRRLIWKTNVDLLTTFSVTLSGEQTIDGVLTSSSDVLVRMQGNPEENGIYTTGAGAWTRRADCDTAAELIDAAVQVNSGTTGAVTNWMQQNDVSVLGVDPIVWVETLGTSQERAVPYTGTDVENYLRITADTTYKKSVSPAFLQHDVAAMICDRITDPDKFYSEVLGGTLTQARTYPDNGAWWNNVLLKCLHLRGYSLTDKIFSLSMKDFFDGAKTAFNLGFSYETIDGVERIVIRKRSEYYDTSQVAFEFLGVQRIKRRYRNEHFNATKFGFSKGKTEDISGIDDTQIRNDASILKNIGRLFTNLTTWIFQGLTIEQARRTVKTKSADYKFDDEIVCIEVSVDGSDYKPRLNEDFDSVTNLLNEASRYNKHHTPARFRLRWSSYLSGGLQNYLGSSFKFTGGEGNYAMVSEMVPGSAIDDYAGAPLAENADIAVSSTYDYIPILYDIEHYCTEAEFDQIDAMRNYGGKISQTQTGSQFFFIEDFSRDKASGQLKMSGYFKEPFNIQSVAGGVISQGGRIFDGSFDFSFE